MLQGPWRVELLGGLRARRGATVITDFGTRPTAALFAYLVYHAGKEEKRKKLAEMFWGKDKDEVSALNSLRNALSTLRDRLQPPGLAPHSVLMTDREYAWISRSGVVTDLDGFHKALQDARNTGDSEEKARHYTCAIDLYREGLLPEAAEDWVLGERSRLAGDLVESLCWMAEWLLETSKTERAIEYAHRAAATGERPGLAYSTLIRCLAERGYVKQAQEQYRELIQAVSGSLPDDLRKTRDWLNQGIRSGRLKQRHLQNWQPPGAPHSPGAAARNRLLYGGSSPDRRPDALPEYPTHFFGRERELGELRRMLLDPLVRLVTVTGPPGLGKSHLAIEAAAQMQDECLRRVVFLSLADLTHASQILTALRDALCLPGTGDPLEQVAQALEAASALLVLDNLDPVVNTGADLVVSLLESSPSLKCLVTTRRLLQVSPEHSFLLSPLPTPEENAPMERLLEEPGIQLFVDAARRRRPHFRLSEGKALDVASLCARLEGIPLSIRLAAARISDLSPAGMLANLEHRFKLLQITGSEEGLRHRTLTAAVEWSVEFLKPEIRSFFEALSLFRGGWTLSAAEFICDEPLAPVYLKDLQANSLIGSTPGPGEMRFVFLETLREFGGSRLDKERREMMGQRHAAFYLNFAQGASRGMLGHEQAVWMERVAADYSNCRAALEWLAERQQWENGLQLACCLDRFWQGRGYLAEAREWLDRMIEGSSGVEIKERAWALCGLGYLCEHHSEPERALALYRESLALSERLGDEESIANAKSHLGPALRRRDPDQARVLIQESLSIRKNLNNLREAAVSLNHLGLLAQDSGAYGEARDFYQQSLELFQDAGDLRNVSYTLLNLSQVEKELGQIQAASKMLERALEIGKELGDEWGQAYTLQNLGSLAEKQGDLDRAEELLEESLEISRKFSDMICGLHALFGLWGAARSRGDSEQASRRQQECLQLWSETGGPADFANALERMAFFAAASGNSAAAGKLFGAAAAAREASGSSRPGGDQVGYEQAIASLRTCLGEERFLEVWAEGQRLGWRKALAWGMETGCPGFPPEALLESHS